MPTVAVCTLRHPEDPGAAQPKLEASELEGPRMWRQSETEGLEASRRVAGNGLCWKAEKLELMAAAKDALAPAGWVFPVSPSPFHSAKAQICWLVPPTVRAGLPPCFLGRMPLSSGNTHRRSWVCFPNLQETFNLVKLTIKINHDNYLKQGFRSCSCWICKL